MRGRTNVGGGGGISINAEVQDMIIHSGTITAGDFVEHYTIDDYIAQVEDVGFVFEMDNCAIGTYGNMVVAYKNGQQVAAYSAYNCNCIGKYENFIFFHDNSQSILGVLTFENNTFTLVSTISTSISADCIGGGNGKVICFSKDTSQIVFGVANISSSGILSDFQSTIVSKSTVDNFGVNAICYYNESFKILFSNGTVSPISSGTYSYSSILAEISIDSNNNITMGEDIATIGGNRILSQKGNKIILANTVRGLYSSNIYYYFTQINILNIETNGISTITLTDQGEALSYINDDGYFIATGKISMRPVWSTNIAYLANKLRLCKYNENAGSITIEDEIVLPDDYSTSQPNTRNVYDVFIDKITQNVSGIDISNIYAQIKKKHIYTRSGSSTSYTTEADKNIYLYNIVNGELETHPQEGYVIPYQSGHPIGVAKNNGSTGDTIGVYIPIPVG